MKTGKVTRKSKYGIQLDNVDEWFNWSRDMEDRTITDTVQAGDVVTIGLVDDKFVTALELVKDAPESPSAPSPEGNDQWVLKDKRVGREVAVKAAAEIMAAYIGNHDTVQWPDILNHYTDLLEKAGQFID